MALPLSMLQPGQFSITPNIWTKRDGFPQVAEGITTTGTIPEGGLPNGIPSLSSMPAPTPMATPRIPQGLIRGIEPAGGPVLAPRSSREMASYSSAAGPLSAKQAAIEAPGAALAAEQAKKDARDWEREKLGIRYVDPVKEKGKTTMTVEEMKTSRKMTMQERQIASDEKIKTLDREANELIESRKNMTDQQKIEADITIAGKKLAMESTLAQQKGEMVGTPEYEKKTQDAMQKTITELGLKTRGELDKVIAQGMSDIYNDPKGLMTADDKLRQAQVFMGLADKLMPKEPVAPATPSATEAAPTAPAPKAPQGDDANGNGIPDEDEVAMAWAKTNKATSPIKAKGIEEAMKLKYPKIYGKEL